ncbi:MAG: SurA N-terminal domain-containing protein [Armatimonadota bacterium]
MIDRRLALFVVAGLLVAFVLSGCGKGSFVSVNGEKISKDEFYKKLELTSIQGRPAGELVLDQMINEKLIDQMAKEKGVLPTEAQINEKIEYLKKDGSLTQVLQQRGLTIDEFKSEIYPRQAMINIVTKGVTVSDKEVNDRYNQIKDRLYTTAANVEIAAVICGKKEKIEKADAQIKQGVDFGTVAMRLSEDKLSNQTQGKLGRVWRGQPGVPTNLIEEAFKLKVGDVSKPFLVAPKGQTPQWVIIKATDRKPKVVRTFNEVKSQCREDVALMKGQTTTDIPKLLQKKRDSSTIIISPERYKQLAKIQKKK